MNLVPVRPSKCVTDADRAGLAQPHRNHKCKSGAAQGNLMCRLRNRTDCSNDNSGNSECTNFHAQLHAAGNSDAKKITYCLKTKFPLAFADSDKTTEGFMFQNNQCQHNKNDRSG